MRVIPEPPTGTPQQFEVEVVARQAASWNSQTTVLNVLYNNGQPILAEDLFARAGKKGVPKRSTIRYLNFWVERGWVCRCAVLRWGRARVVYYLPKSGEVGMRVDTISHDPVPRVRPLRHEDLTVLPGA
jgi:hypothetical protein